MARVLLFKPGMHAKEIDMRYLDDVEQKNHVERFKAAGYLENPQLVCMWNPTIKEQVFCLLTDQSIWEGRGYFATPTWVYHPTEAPKGKIVSNEESKMLLANGWYDNPAKYPGNKLGISKETKTLILPKSKTEGEAA